jgi:GNAT superfamily N-acetyltransferase
MDSGSNNSQVNNVGIDFIREVNIKSSNFSAEYGRNSGSSINVVTKGGGDQYHGGAFEFFRNEKLDAKSYFAPIKGPLRYNNFGWNLGGRLIRGKLFFFGGQEYKRIRKVTEPVKIITYADGTTLNIRQWVGGYGKITFTGYVDGVEACYGSISERGFESDAIPVIYGKPYRDYSDDDPDDDELSHYTLVPYIVAVRTHDEFKRRGYGTQIMECMHEYLRNEGQKCVTLNATSQGRQLYLTLGYNEANMSQLLKRFLSRADELVACVQNQSIIRYAGAL